MKFFDLLQFVTPQRRILALVVLLLLLESVVSLTHPWMAGQLTRAVLNDTASAGPAIELILMSWLGLLMARSVIGFSSHYLIGSTGENLAAGLRQRIVDKQLRLSLPDFQAKQPGDFLALLANDAGIISNFVTQTLVQLLPQLLTLFGAAVLIAWLDPIMAMLAILPLPLYCFGLYLTGQKIRPLASAWISSWTAMISRVEENLELFPAIKAFTREIIESARFSKLNQRLLKLSKRQLLIQSALSPVMGLMAGSVLLLLLWYGTQQLKDGHLQSFELVSLILYALLMIQPLTALAGVYGQIVQTRGAAERLLEFFSLPQETAATQTAPISELRGDIEFRNVCFAYPGKPQLLQNFNLTIEAGETIALTGPNGAGKSTLVQLLMGFLQPASGQVLIDGRDIQQLQPLRVREQIALVAQQTLLQNATVAENIAWGCPDASPQTIHAAARAAGAQEFINALPEKFATQIGHQGLRLSGGQRQCLALARAIVKDPSILVLDEATALLDPGTEQAFIKNCNELMSKRTVLLINHRTNKKMFPDRELRLVLGKLE